VNREQRRAKAKHEKKFGTEANEEASQKIALFGKLPNECQACLAAFDKKDKEQVMSWSVVVRNDIEQVRLYCPDCWQKAREVVQAYEKENGYGSRKEKKDSI
jgi:hypothetical protein